MLSLENNDSLSIKNGKSDFFAPLTNLTDHYCYFHRLWHPNRHILTFKCLLFASDADYLASLPKLDLISIPAVSPIVCQHYWIGSVSFRFTTAWWTKIIENVHWWKRRPWTVLMYNRLVLKCDFKTYLVVFLTFVYHHYFGLFVAWHLNWYRSMWITRGKRRTEICHNLRALFEAKNNTIPAISSRVVHLNN